MHGGGVDGHRLLRRHVRPVLQVVVLPLLLRLEVQARQAAQVLAAHSLVDRGAAADALAVVVRDLRWTGNRGCSTSSLGSWRNDCINDCDAARPQGHASLAWLSCETLTMTSAPWVKPCMLTSAPWVKPCTQVNPVDPAPTPDMPPPASRLSTSPPSA